MMSNMMYKSLGFLLVLLIGYPYIILEGDNKFSKTLLKDGNSMKELPIYICDYSFLSKNERYGITKDAILVDICSSNEPIYIDRFIFNNLPIKNREIFAIVYYPYTENNIKGEKIEKYYVNDFKKENSTLIITGPYKIYPSNHSNIFVIILKDNKPSSENLSPKDHSATWLLSSILLGCIVTLGIIFSRWVLKK